MYYFIGKSIMWWCNYWKSQLKLNCRVTLLIRTNWWIFPIIDFKTKTGLFPWLLTSVTMGVTMTKGSFCSVFLFQNPVWIKQIFRLAGFVLEKLYCITLSQLPSISKPFLDMISYTFQTLQQLTTQPPVVMIYKYLPPKHAIRC